MSLTSKDMVFGAAGAAAFLGLVVYHQHKFNKLQGEIDELKEETRIMAQYIKILESKVAGDFQTILSSNEHHHHHAHAHAALPAAQPVQASQVTHTPQPALEDVKPQAPLIPEQPKRVAQPVQLRQPVKQAAPVRAQPVKPVQPPAAPAKRAAPPARQMPPRKPVAVQQEESESVDNSQEDENQKEEASESESERSDDESAVQNSNRRAGNNTAKPVVSQGRSSGRPTPPNAGVRSTNQPQNPVPPRNPPAKAASSDRAPPPVPQKHVITVEEGRPPKDKEESYNPAEENNKAVEISGGRPTPPKAGGPRTTGPKSGGEKKRFGPKTDDSEDSDMYVSSSKLKTKSILKNPISNNKSDNESKAKSGSRAEKDSETSIDADLADDMAMVAAKSNKKMEDNEGREVGPTEARMRMASTAQRAEDMRKKAEERAKKISESAGS